jgi:hypothetical protein
MVIFGGLITNEFWYRFFEGVFRAPAVVQAEPLVKPRVTWA